MGRVLEEARSAELVLDDEETGQLLGPAAEDLAGAGIEVLWPSELAGDGLALRAVLTPTPSPAAVTEGGFSLDALLDFHWEMRLGGETLTAEEVAALGVGTGRPARRRPLPPRVRLTTGC
ncbi:MAG: hypothetical protein DLM65_13165 [Candidatus Aeolococcus gillhamiae]|uniref:DUF3670 domain-containing protein n=1 Tax=Candidatus Aeolococcus gillhamiae TaxID=3127015 RepID=A0A2W5YZD5_9BACT|nr:MAG: hypothetical protein DLM65_13165 [Candidatus Dormibacter sp. RRmetagenome_bin12]